MPLITRLLLVGPEVFRQLDLMFVGLFQLNHSNSRNTGSGVACTFHVCTSRVAHKNEMFFYPTMSLAPVSLTSSGKKRPDAQKHGGLQEILLKPA